MQTQVYSIDEIPEIVAPIAKQHGVDKVFLFGSYAREMCIRDSTDDSPSSLCAWLRVIDKILSIQYTEIGRAHV